MIKIPKSFPHIDQGVEVEVRERVEAAPAVERGWPPEGRGPGTKINTTEARKAL